MYFELIFIDGKIDQNYLKKTNTNWLIFIIKGNKTVRSILTFTRISISIEIRITSTCKSTSIVGTSCICMTVICACCTFVNIYIEGNKMVVSRRANDFNKDRFINPDRLTLWNLLKHFRLSFLSNICLSKKCLTCF